MIRPIVYVLLFLLLLAPAFLNSEELPWPTYDNSLMFAITYDIVVGSPSEVDYIKNQFGSGIYAPLLFSTFKGVDMDWNINPADSGDGIENFKDFVDRYVAKAKQYGVGMHLILTYGIPRNVNFYMDAKIEDVRNAQWYNDNNISTQAQMKGTSSTDESETGTAVLLNRLDNISVANPFADESVINKYVFTTTSRYARKLRNHLEAKVASAYAYLKQAQDANPDVTIIVSAPGESEMNYNRINDSQYMQDYFCDYSPFAVLEFRDWIKHEGLYADGEEYAGEGYASGGSRYQGAAGLSNFNSDFGTSFSTWDLRYFNWSLTDAVDTDYTDGVNPDPHAIPVAQYAYNAMRPTSGANYISGGFDPPRTMQEKGSNDFYDLWETFRQTMIYHYVRDMSAIARDSGFTKSHYYTHQIPADYLFGTRPYDPLIPYLNPRYYSSASPLWTADAYSDIGMGITLYDINYGTWYARTSQYVMSAINSLSGNWAALEYNPEVHPYSGITISSVDTIYNEFVRLYNNTAHVVSLFYWLGNAEWQYKDTNRETAVKQFFDGVKDKARQAMTTVFTPKQVEDVSCSYNSVTGLVSLDWSSKIWSDLNYQWNDWGDFKEYVVYRGYTEDFTIGTGAEIVRKTSTGHVDYGFLRGTTVYYKVAAVNGSGQVGPTQTVSVVVPEGTVQPILNISRERLNFGYVVGGETPPTQTYLVSNTGTGALNWTAVDDAEWLSCSPDSEVLGAKVTVSVDPTGLAVGTYSGTITVDAPLAANSPKTITVYLTVKNSSQNKLPFGEFATPDDGSTVSSSIAVTGWVLDDVGVENVKIYRDPVTGEGSNIVYIGDALFVEGARPDIEVAYPDYPANYKAGWGYMMLTNFLPNNGNGTFKIYAIAEDTYGYEVTLGTKTITCDNANAVKPFGAIDTPAQGGSASGTNFKNHGWALTPMPNSIPTDGSTIHAYIDGVDKGHIVYNIYRSDIAAYFPGYANSGNAGGYFEFDTTMFPEGIHSIAWVATDFAGNSDGIGSRYFTIENTGGGDASAAKADHRAPMWLPAKSGIPVDLSGPVRVFTGYKKDAAAGEIRPGKDGIITIQTRELERIEIRFAGRVLNLSALPVGSTLDSEKGIFYWQPGAGFVGDYTFEFLVGDGINNKLERKPVNIKIQTRF